MPQNTDNDPLTLKGFLYIFAVCLVFWGVLALIAMVLYFPETFHQ